MVTYCTRPGRGLVALDQAAILGAEAILPTPLRHWADQPQQHWADHVDVASVLLWFQMVGAPVRYRAFLCLHMVSVSVRVPSWNPQSSPHHRIVSVKVVLDHILESKMGS